MNNEFKILACFTRSYDKYHDSNNLHLIASTILVRDSINYENFRNYIKKSNTSRKFIIFEVFDKNEEIILDSSIEEDIYEPNSYLIEKENYVYARLSFNRILKKPDLEIDFRDLFFYDYTETKSKDQIYTQCLFIFHNITWSNIVFKFKLNGIDISGGGTTTRHILSSSDIILGNYLNIFFNFDSDYIAKLGFNTYKNEKVIMSSQIPLNFYRSYLDKMKEIYKLSGTANDIINKLKLLINSSNNDSSDSCTSSASTSSSDEKFIKIIAENLLISRDIIIQKLILHNKKDLMAYINEQLTQKNNKLYSLRDDLKKFETSTKGMSNKNKKRLKKERTELLKKGLKPDILSEKINKIHLEISNLENKKALKTEELNKKIDNFKKWSFGELFQQYEGLGSKIKDKNSLLINKKSPVFNKYRSLERKFLRNYSLSTYIVNKNDISITNSNNNQILFGGRRFCTSHKVSFIEDSDNNYGTTQNSHSISQSLSIDESALRALRALQEKMRANNFILFNEIRKLIENNPINHDTQLKIEEFLYNYSLNTDKSINIFEAIGRLNKSLKNIFIESEKELLVLIKNFMKRDLDLHLNETKLKKKDTPYFYLSVILKEIPIDFLVSLLLGKILIIINNPTEESNNCVDIFGIVGKQIIQFYFFSLYKKEQKRLNNNQNISDIEKNYSMSSWKKDNSHIIEIYDNDLIHKMGGLAMDWLREIDLLEIKLVQSYEDYRKNINIFKVTDRIEKLLVRKLKPLNIPNKIPMIVVPNQYIRLNNKEEIIEEYGGFLLNKELTQDELIIPNWRLKQNSKIEELNQVYKAVNNISSVGYKINKDVLNFIRLYDSKFHLTLRMNETVKNILNKLSMPSEELKSNHSYKTNYSHYNFKNKLYKWERIELESYQSKKYVEDNILALADLFENVPEFFIPVRMDYRGRIYCMTEYLNYQGNDLAKGLLLFSKSEKILKTDLNAINYLKIFGANCFGNKLDKKSFVERVKWIDDNTENIRNFYNGNLLSKAESKILFLAFCFEYNRWLDCLDNSESTYFYSALPIQLDATCNGYQHLAMLGLNTSLANHLNLKKSSKEDNPDDFYTFISSFLYGYYEKKLKEDISEINRESFKRLKSLQIQRSVIKKTIMTIPYNASSIQGIKYLTESFEFDKDYTNDKVKNLQKEYELLTENENNLGLLESDRENINMPNLVSLVPNHKENKSLFTLDALEVENFNMKTALISTSSQKKHIKPENYNKIVWFRHKQDHNIKLKSLDFLNLYRGLIFVLNDVFPTLNLLTQYLKDIAYICSKLEISIPWRLPTGLVANQSYMKLKDVRIKPLNYSNYTFKLKVADKNKLDKDKQIRAFMPNLIHSLDSATLVMLINNYFIQKEAEYEYKNIYAIHDCFAVTAKNVDFIINNLKMIYISLYSNKGYLLKLNNEIINHIKNHIGNDFDEETLIINLYKQKPFKFPDIHKVLSEDFDINLLKDSAYIIN